MKVRILIVIAFLIGYFYPFQVLGNELKKQDIPGSNYIEDEVSITEWIITPTSLVTNEIQPRQRIEMNIQSTQAIKSFVLQVWSGTTLLEEIPLEGIKPGKNEISVLIPEPQDTILSRWILRSSLKTLKEKDLKWIPPRHWTIYVIKSTHMDLGLHKPMYIQRYESGQFFTQAKELSEETKDWPESSRYRYFMEGMNWWYSYAQDYSDSLANILIDRYVKSDLITIGASHSGNHTQSFGSEEMV
ncbi:MAG: hypothetical protein LBT43_13395, partial [Prevotella sp.]|nr:hypothetical protein [Prevotella sp.]